MAKCINYECPIINNCGQICTTLYPKSKQIDNVNQSIKLKKFEPYQSSGSWYCYQFGD
jgi:hypothetical protein